MPAGAAPGERRGGRKKGVPNGKTAQRKADIHTALTAAFAALGPSVIDTLSPAKLQLIAMREAAKAGHIQAALSIAKDVAPYYDAKLAPKPEYGDEVDAGQRAAGYAVIPEQAPTMDAWATQAQQELKPEQKSGDPSRDPSPSY